MRPLAGVAIELVVLSSVFLASVLVPAGLTYAIYVLVSEFLATYLIHCPAHYATGMALGIRFERMRIGRTTLSKALPSPFSRLGPLLAVPTLATVKSSVARVSKRRAALMYASGTVGSTLAAFVVAAAASPHLSTVPLVLAWLLAAGYLAFDVVYSPKTGDLMRARRALT